MKIATLAVAILSCSLASRTLFHYKDVTDLLHCDCDCADDDSPCQSCEPLKTTVIDSTEAAEDNDALLLYAVQRSSVKATRWLLTNGCLISARREEDAESKTKIMDAAIRSDKKDLVQLLFEFGANPKNVSTDLVLRLVSNGDLELCRLLDQYGYPFKSFSAQFVPAAALNGQLEMLQFLTEIGYFVTSHPEHLEVCQRVRQKGHLEIYNLLLAKLTNEDLKRMLGHAAASGNLYMVKYLTAHVVEKDGGKQWCLRDWENILHGSNAAVTEAISSQIGIYQDQ